MVFKIIVSFIFLIVFVMRVIKPEWNIDTISIILLILASAPWFAQYIKSLEINGIGKLELVNKEQKKEIEQKAIDIGIVDTKIKEIDNQKYSFYNLRHQDLKLALAGLRIEIESALREIADKNNLDIPFSGLRELTNILSRNELISRNEQAIIFDITGILNKAVHSQLLEYKIESLDWVFDLGLNVLNSLKSK